MSIIERVQIELKTMLDLLGIDEKDPDYALIKHAEDENFITVSFKFTHFRSTFCDRVVLFAPISGYESGDLYYDMKTELFVVIITKIEQECIVPWVLFAEKHCLPLFTEGRNGENFLYAKI